MANEIRFSPNTVPVGDRLVPEWVELEHGEPDGPTLFLRGEVIDGVPQCREVRLWSDAGADQIRDTDIKIRRAGRWVGVGEHVEVLFARGTRRRVRDDGAIVEMLPTEDEARRESVRTLRNAAQSSRRKMTPRLLMEVADVYRAGASAPTQAVQDHFALASHRTAASWVQRARKDGYLSETTPGKAGG